MNSTRTRIIFGWALWVAVRAAFIALVIVTVFALSVLALDKRAANEPSTPTPSPGPIPTVRMQSTLAHAIYVGSLR